MKRYEKTSYFKMLYQDFIIYGYEDDSPYEEDHYHIDKLVSRGRIFGFWFSIACPNGEYGSNPLGSLIAISQKEFENAKEKGWG